VDDEAAPWRAELDAPVLAGLDPLVRATLRELAQRFWSDAGAVDAAPGVPASHLQGLAGARLYGVSAPVDEGGLGLGFGQVCGVVEELAAGCVASTFLWGQHLRLLNLVLAPETPASWRDRLLPDVVAGRCKGGVALTGLMPGPPRLSAETGAGGAWYLSGAAPWVSGWGTVDKLVAVARGPSTSVVTFLLDACEQPGLAASRLRLSALDATGTVRLAFDGVVVPAERVLDRRPYEPASSSGESLRLNGSYALGLVKRCCILLGPSPLDAELRDRREQLDSSGAEEMPAARAAACELAVRAAHAVSVARGSSSALAGDVGERLAREANVLLVFGSRPAIRSELLRRFGAS
jgi:alkylation response protein AidB-like acyl-CoA dehydrogenase